MRSTHTYAILEVSPTTYAEIRAKLLAAGYEHAFHCDNKGDAIDMNGIAIAESKESANGDVLL